MRSIDSVCSLLHIQSFSYALSLEIQKLCIDIV